MKTLILGGTGVISGGIVKHLLARGAEVTLYNRGRRPLAPAAQGVRRIRGDRSDPSGFERAFETSRYDVVIDMICFTPEQAASTVRAFGGRCEQLQFCSTVCTYGAKIPPQVLADEQFPQEPVTAYGRDKAACERVFERAAAQGRFRVTIFRPSHTYGPGGPLIDQLEAEGPAWDRIARGLPVLCAGDGLGLWQSTHRDDCGQLFAHAALNPRTYGEAYNATHDEVFTWRDYYRKAAAALGARARLIFAPAGWLVARRPERFGLLREVTRFHGAYSSEKAKAHVPGFRARIDFATGAREMFADLRSRGALCDSRADADYQALVDEALGRGFTEDDA
jgi:nucleoside-diphosphate-sugar epimerase